MKKSWKKLPVDENRGAPGARPRERERDIGEERCPLSLRCLQSQSSFASKHKMEDDDHDRRSQHKILVAMKGHPGCAKSTVARALARALRCPVIDKDDIRDCTLELEQREIISSSAAARPSSSVLLCESCGSSKSRGAAAAAFSSSSSSSSTSSSVLNTLSYDVMWKVVETQLQVGLSVIVDCPLARPDLFKTACCLADRYGCRIMVVECRSGDENEWKLRLEARARAMAAALMANEDDDAEEELLMQAVESSSSSGSFTSHAGPVKKIDVELEEQAAGFIKANAAAIDSKTSRHVLESTWGRSGSCAEDAAAATSCATDHAPGFRPRMQKKMHKPSQWADIEKLLAGYAGCWEYDTGTTSKLVIDTTALSREAAVEAVLHWLNTERYASSPTVQFVP